MAYDNEKSAESGSLKIKLGIVGCGEGAISTIDLMRHDHAVEIVFLCDSDQKAPGIKIAKTNNIEVLDNIDAIKRYSVDVILNLTGSVETGLKIQKVIKPDVELLGVKSAKLISSITGQRQKRLEERDRAAKEKEIFHSLGLQMEKIDNMKDAGFAIIEYGTRLSDMRAAVVSSYDETEKEMVLLSSCGIDGFEENMRWRADDCAATKLAMTNKGFEPVSLDSFEIEQSAARQFIDSKVKSIIAVPLFFKEKVHSVLYLCDFAERVFLKEDMDTLALLGVYCSLLMNKVTLLEKMRHLIVTDGLTGLANQRYFMERLEKEFHRSTRYSHDLSIVVFDIDNFKSYIDKHGHLQGNELLKHLSKLLNQSVRQTDIVARFGVEKFCILLCEIGKEGAFTFAQRLVERIASYPMPNENITVSAGVASSPRDAEGYMELLSKSEGNLHKAKQWGMNRACS